MGNRPDADEEETEMKLAIRSVFAAALCVLLCAAVYAAPDDSDIYYSGPLDSVTGQPLTSAAAETARVWLSDGMYYDFDRHAYAYPVGDGLYDVYASVANGMIVTESSSSAMPTARPNATMLATSGRSKRCRSRLCWEAR